MAPRYGPIAKAVIGRFASVVVRFSATGGLTAASIRTAAIQQRFRSNLCDSRETAVALLEHLVNRRSLYP